MPDTFQPEEEASAVPRNYRAALEQARRRFVGREPRIDAETAGVAFVDLGGGRGRFEIPVLGRPYRISWPELHAESETGETASPVLQILLLHYLLTSDGITPRGEWVSFRDLPDGRVYYRAFREGSELRLLGRFGNDITGFCRAAEALGGKPLPLADHAFAFQVLPRLPMAVLLWEGDEEFSPEIRILFDTSAANYLPTEDLAVIARYLTGCLIRAGTGNAV
ncbi:MAG: DUF3786 domain-containing protein [Chloroflexia bacterium]